MAVKTDELRGKLAKRPENGGGKPQTIQDWLNDPRIKAEIARALPRHVDPDRLTRVALTVIRQNPELRECTVPSLLAAVMQCAQLGLEPGVLGHAYLVPFRNSRTGTREVQFIIGYKGMVDLIRRSGQVESIVARIVYENDEFSLSYGIQDELRHVPWHMREGYSEPGRIRGAYMVARFKDGGYHVHYMPIAKIEERRKRSKAGQSGPWVTDYEAMCLKTVVRDAFRWLPVSVEIMRGVAQDESIKRSFEDVDSEAPDYGDTIDADYHVHDAPADDGEPGDAEQQGLGV